MSKQHKIKNVNVNDKTGVCSVCGPVKVKINHGNYWRCMVAFTALKYKTSAELLNSLEKKCMVCNSKKQIVHDHDHTTGEFRGFLCHRCNITIGMVSDEVLLLEKMIQYLSQRSFLVHERSISSISSWLIVLRHSL